MNVERRSIQAAPVSWATKASLISSGILSAYEFSGLVPVLPHIQSAFADVPGSAVLVRFMISCLGVSMIIGSPISSFLAEKFGFRRVLSIALLVYALAGMAGAAIDNLYVLVASRIVFGLGAAACGTLLMSMIVEFSDRERNRWLGILTMVGCSASIILVPLAGYLGETSWRIPFLLHAVALPVVVLVLFGIRSDPHADRHRAAISETALKPSARPRLPVFLIGLSVVMGILTSALQLFVPFYLRDIGLGDSRETGLLISATVITTGLVSVLYGWLRTYLTLRNGFIVSLIIMGLAYMMTVTTHGAGTFVLSMLFLGIGVGIAMPHFYALAAITGPPADAARNIGMARAGYYSGPLVSQFLLEPVVAVSHAYVAILAVAIMALAVSVLLLKIRIPYHTG